MWPNPQVTADLVTFTEEIFNEKLHFLCSDSILSHANHNYANNSSWFIKTDDNITLFWTVFGFGKWFSYFNWERLAYVFSKKKAMKDFLSLWCIPKISNEDIIAAVCLRNELIETVPDETRDKYERNNSYLLKPLDHFNLPNDCWF